MKFKVKILYVVLKVSSLINVSFFFNKLVLFSANNKFIIERSNCYKKNLEKNFKLKKVSLNPKIPVLEFRFSKHLKAGKMHPIKTLILTKINVNLASPLEALFMYE